MGVPVLEAPHLSHPSRVWPAPPLKQTPILVEASSKPSQSHNERKPRAKLAQRKLVRPGPQEAKGKGVNYATLVWPQIYRLPVS